MKQCDYFGVKLANSLAKDPVIRGLFSLVSSRGKCYQLSQRPRLITLTEP